VIESDRDRVTRMYTEQDMLHDGTHPVLKPVPGAHGVALTGAPPSFRFGMYDVRFAGPGSICYPPCIIINPENFEIGEGSRIDSMTKIESGIKTVIGRFVHVASFAHIGIGGGNVELGDFSAVASGARLISGSNQIDAISMSACAPKEMQRVEKKFVILEKYAVVLAGATVLPGVTLRTGAVLAAGAVATRDVPAWEIWAGVPAKFLAKRVIK
jgi:acetyltransferase-like isoleucine patch superfamily enzyme